MKTHSIAAAAQSLDLFATRFCMPTPQALQQPGVCRKCGDPASKVCVVNKVRTGGVGPMAITMRVHNTIQAAKRSLELANA